MDVSMRTHTQCQVRTLALSNFPELLTFPQSHTVGVPSHELLQVVAKLNALPKSLKVSFLAGTQVQVWVKKWPKVWVSEVAQPGGSSMSPPSPWRVTCCGSLGKLLQLFSLLGKENKIVQPHQRGAAHHCQGLGKLSAEASYYQYDLVNSNYAPFINWLL